MFAMVLHICVFFVVAFDSVQDYHVALTGYLAASLVLSSSSVNQLIYSSVRSRRAAGAGFLVLCILDAVWIAYFGSEPSSTPRAFLDCLALPKVPTPVRRRRMTDNSHAGSRLGVSGRSDDRRTSGFPRAEYSENGAATQCPLQRSQTGHDSDSARLAKAIYSHEANPEDPRELSFAQHETLYIFDTSGEWWLARTKSGSEGIIPSNYVTLL